MCLSKRVSFRDYGTLSGVVRRGRVARFAPRPWAPRAVPIRNTCAERAAKPRATSHACSSATSSGYTARSGAGSGAYGREHRAGNQQRRPTCMMTHVHCRARAGAACVSGWRRAPGPQGRGAGPGMAVVAAPRTRAAAAASRRTRRWAMLGAAVLLLCGGGGGGVEAAAPVRPGAPQAHDGRMHGHARPAR